MKILAIVAMAGASVMLMAAGSPFAILTMVCAGGLMAADSDSVDRFFAGGAVLLMVAAGILLLS